jgi:hypothetical protein
VEVGGGVSDGGLGGKMFSQAVQWIKVTKHAAVIMSSTSCQVCLGEGGKVMRFGMMKRGLIGV